jgi:hypothetical protein
MADAPSHSTAAVSMRVIGDRESATDPRVDLVVDVDLEPDKRSEEWLDPCGDRVSAHRES